MTTAAGASIGPRTRRGRDPLKDGFLIAAVAYVVVVLAGFGDGRDAHAYWSVQWPHPYPTTYAVLSDGFNYAPPVALAFLPFSVLPWPVFHAAWSVLNLAALYLLVGRWAVVAIFLPPVAIEVWAGNTNLLIAAAIASSFRYPGAWAVPLLTKVGPGIGVLWYPFRGEWRLFLVAIATTAAIALASLIIAPGSWSEWIAYLVNNAGATVQPGAIPIPLLVRFPFAIAVLAVAALSDRPWLVPVACTVALPVLFPANLTILLACWPLRPGAGMLRAASNADARSRRSGQIATSS